MTLFEDDMKLLSESFEGIMVNENISNAFKKKARVALRQSKPDMESANVEKAAKMAWDLVKSGKRSEEEVLSKITGGDYQQPQEEPESITPEVPNQTTGEEVPPNNTPQENQQGLFGKAGDVVDKGLGKLKSGFTDAGYKAKTSQYGVGGHRLRQAKNRVNKYSKKIANMKTKALSDSSLIDDYIAEVDMISSKIKELFKNEPEGKERHLPKIKAIAKFKQEAERVKSALDSLSQSTTSQVTESARHNLTFTEASLIVEFKSLVREIDEIISTF